MEIEELLDWAFDELVRGSRVKASKIIKVYEKMKAKQILFYRKYLFGLKRIGGEG